MIACLLIVLATQPPAVLAGRLAPPMSDARFGPADLAKLADVTEPAFSPDGEHVVYTVSTVNQKADASQTDLWRVDYDGSNRKRLSDTPEHDESRPQWSPDGKSIAFLSDRGDKDAETQVWLMPVGGGKARKLTSVPAGVEDYVWAPDGKRMALIAWDPEYPPGTTKPKNPPPIVIERFQFKEDGVGYLGARRKHLYLFDIKSGKAELLTPGSHDEQLLSWSPDGRHIAYVTKRGADPDRHLNWDIYLIEPRVGATERQLTTFAGSDLDPYWETRPQWSPDSSHLAYLSSGEDKWIYYAPWQLAVIEVATGKSAIPAPIDRCFYKARWAPDGKSLYTLVEQSKVTHAARVPLEGGKPEYITTGKRFEYDIDVAANGRVVVLGGTFSTPHEISAVEPAGLRALTDHNAFLARKRLGVVEDFSIRAKDGTTIEGLLIKPPDYVAGTRYPAILRLHGGPVYQFSHEFVPDLQAYAAQGYVVIAPNPRGSSGRGFDFARAIYADWGNVDVQDVLAAVDHVVAQGIADPARLGVGGRSYGGMLTHYVIARDQRFKAAVSGAGGTNSLGSYGHDMYARELELELGTPWGNREAYERVSYPFLHADRITTPTQFYCAEEDLNVPCHGAEQMYQALRSRGVPAQLIVYPGESHSMAVPSYLRDRLERALAWYRRYLEP